MDFGTYFGTFWECKTSLHQPTPSGKLLAYDWHANAHQLLPTHNAKPPLILVVNESLVQDTQQAAFGCLI